MAGFDVILQVAFLGRSVLADRAHKLPRADMKLYMLLEVASIRCLVVAVWADQGLGPVVHLPRVPRHLVLV